MSDEHAAWHTHAARRARDGRWTYQHFGPEQRLRIFYANASVVPVTLTEDPNGSHYGWITVGHDEPTMIQPTRHQFEVQFPYGWRSEQDRGHGRMVRLRVEEVKRGS